MPHRKSAQKHLRKSVERKQRNRGVKSRLKTETGKFQRALERRDVREAEGRMQQVTKLLQQAASKGVIHKNKAARRESRLASRLNQVRSTA